MTIAEQRGESPEAAPQIETVHIVFKTHLDIGFTDFARNVVEQYHTRFIPQALATAKALRARGGAERMTWTTGSWLIYEHLERAAPAERRALEAAIAAGDIAWHALPFTTHTELLDPSLFAFGLSLSGELDRRFGKQTIAGKLTDVPGHTRGMVPLLAAAGVQFLHIGVNPASTPPAVPPVCVWQAGGAELLLMYQRGAYGDLTIVPGLADALYIAHTDDNRGPQTPDQVLAIFERLQARFPDARIIASTLDAFARKLLAIAPQLPVLRAELGDTWIHGAGSDPLRLSRFRELQRLRSGWLSSGQAHADDPALGAFSRQLLMVAEHTWGLDEKTFLAGEQTYAAAAFRAARPAGGFRTMEQSWREQRGYVDAAVAALGPTPLAQQAHQALDALAPAAPDLAGFEPVRDRSALIETAHFRIVFDSASGAIVHLEDKAGGRRWADPAHPLALLDYQVFGQADYDRFIGQYIINLEQTKAWSLQDFGKPGLGSVLAEGRSWVPALAALYQRRDGDGQRFVAELRLPDECSEQFGAPRQIALEVFLPDAAPRIELALQWFDKPACRIAEAIWLSFAPAIADEYGWRLDKLGEAVEPHDVIADGNRKLHAVGHGAVYRDAAGRFELATLDAPLVAPGERSLLDFNNRQPPAERGMHVNLLNNIWGTNFQMWYDDDARFRFTLAFS